MKKSFILACTCIVGYMVLTSHLVTKITDNKKNNNPQFSKSVDFSILKDGFRLNSTDITNHLNLEFSDPKLFKQVSISDEDGQKFYVSSRCKGKVLVNTKACSTGVYYVNLLKFDGSRFTKSFVINK